MARVFSVSSTVATGAASLNPQAEAPVSCSARCEQRVAQYAIDEKARVKTQPAPTFSSRRHSEAMDAGDKGNRG